MSKRFWVRMVALSGALSLCGCVAQRDGHIGLDGTSDGAGYVIGERSPVRDWIVLGAFENPELEEPLADGTWHAGFSHDFLESLGGETGIKVVAHREFDARGIDGERISVRAQPVIASDDGTVDFDAMYSGADFKVAYAFGTIHSESDQVAGFFFGSDDGAKVWVNGELAHRVYTARGMRLGEDVFAAPVKRGANTVLVKVAERVGGWRFAMDVADSETYTAFVDEQRSQRDFRALLNCRIVPQLGNLWDYTFDPGPFPELAWDNPQLVKQSLGDFELRARWFDAGMNEVFQATEPGRYGFVVEGTSASGVHIRRGGTLYCRPRYWLGWSERPSAYLENLFADGVDPDAWDEHREAIASHVGRELMLSILGQDEGGAILMSYLDEMEVTGEPPSVIDTPLIRNADYHLALKRRVLGVEDKWADLELPKQVGVGSGLTLRAGTSDEAGVLPETADNIRKVCEQWYEESGEPFVTLVARHGVIVFHEATGEDQHGKVTTDTRFPLASLTKTISGLMFAQFVEQGLIEIDSPVGESLPDFPTEGEKAITLRQCFTHTSGLYGHEEYGGVHNPWMENVISSGLEGFTPGQRSSYNGTGYNLAGKVMEMISGKSIFRLTHENFFEPLGASSTIMDEDLAFGCNTTAGDLAKIGQLLLNRGTYGGREYFSPAVFEQLLPRPLDEFYPGVRGESGIGLAWSRDWHPGAGQDGVPENANVFGDNVIGHGSATSCVLRVALDHDLVIVQVRRRGGRAYYENLSRMLMAVEQGLISED